MNSSAHLRRRQRWQIGLITAGRSVFFVFVRQLPTGTNLAHVDFQGPGGGSLQVCDPANPAFMPVLSVKSPVVMTLSTDSPRRWAADARCACPANGVRKGHRTAGSAGDAHQAPAPDGRRSESARLSASASGAGGGRGEWTWSSRPAVPADTGCLPILLPPPRRAVCTHRLSWMCRGGRTFRLRTTIGFTKRTDGGLPLRRMLRLRARAVVNLALVIEPVAERRPVRLEPVMGRVRAPCRDRWGRSGFAHLHPQQADLNRPLDPLRPRLTFQVQIPESGRYVVWSQVKIDGQERFAPFWIEVGAVG